MILMFSVGFITFDTLKMIQCIEDKSNLLVKQTFFHHFTAIVGFSSAFFSGYSFTGLGCLGLYSEISSIFLNYDTQLKNYS